MLDLIIAAVLIGLGCVVILAGLGLVLVEVSIWMFARVHDKIRPGEPLPAHYAPGGIVARGSGQIFTEPEGFPERVLPIPANSSHTRKILREVSRRLNPDEE